MTDRRKSLPPRWATRFLAWYCRPELLEDLQGDLNEYFDRNIRSKGRFKARLIYILDVIKFCRPYMMKKIYPVNTMNNLIIFQNYFKTSWRTIAKNKFFSALNIAGLAISMCVGLLLIALVTELSSYDSFHKNAHRIYRVNTIWQESDSPYKYASTSILAGKNIKETVTGVERVVMMRRGFNRDVRFEDKVVPLRGFWADENFFQVFSFQLISGNAATALKDPHSIVLSKSSALKLFGEINVTGNLVQIDTVNYIVSGVVQDPPMNSHMRFDMLGSFSTLEGSAIAADKNWLKWDFIGDNYVYVLLPEENNWPLIEKSLARISAEGNKTLENGNKADLYLEPLLEIALTSNMSHSIGPSVDKSGVVTIGILAIVVILSACFNYTNLSIARALRRAREVGIRKVVGATRRQVFYQFIVESVLLTILSLALSVGFFLMLRKEFVSMNRAFQEMVTLNLTTEIGLYFIGLALVVGILAGILPASFFSRINTARVLKDLSTVKLFGQVNFRKALIVFQYTLSILFIVLVSIGYKQYSYSLAFDLGFQTENVFTIDLQQNKPEPLIKELSALPEIKQIAQAKYVSSVGANLSGHVRYNDPADSAEIHYNFVDPEYLPLHEHKLLAGENFKPVLSENARESAVIINQRMVASMKLSDPDKAIGEELVIDGEKFKVIGVVEDFHHNRVNYPIQNFAFRYNPAHFAVVSMKIQSADMPATMEKIQAIWKKVDGIHPLQAKFYEDHIHEAYDKLSWILKIIGFIAFLAISIASLGLLGMVVFTTETRLKEISIRKMLGASEGTLVLMMSRGFITLLIISSMIAIPASYYFMDQVVFASVVYRAPIGIMDLLMGTMAVMGIAFLMIGSQTLKVARTNPAEVLKTE
jgi:putative ABC transport system permease protein